jgi:rubrerythrin
LNALYKDETKACLRYGAFAQKAKEEQYQNVARLFLALQSSERIHARNFRDILKTLGARAVEKGKRAIDVGDTGANLPCLWKPGIHI